ncbi:hypothetical protein [Sulfuricurvum sp.]|uniref:hypothetical protein n=1 Tax=Sulfuricurvum sp. TaxID=2025608 RepID=UPI003BB6033D
MPTRYHYILYACAFISPLWGDVLSYNTMVAQERLQSNPTIFDRSDQFCLGKKPQESCVITATHFSGGGEGVCINGQSADKSEKIDLICQRSENIYIERGLPKGGFVADSRVCSKGKNISKHPQERNKNCKPILPPPPDRFCRAKKSGDSCTVEFTYHDKNEKETGVCREMFEEEHYYLYGHRSDTRIVLRCEPIKSVERIFTPISVIQKLTQ